MLKVGLIGTGYIGNVHAECWKKIQGVDLYSVCDTNIMKAKHFAKKFKTQAFDNISDFLDSGIDILDVCIPTPFHLAIVEQALEKRIAVLCEKPIASNYEDAKKMIKMSREKNTLLMIAHCVRFDPYYAYIKDIIQGNKFGKMLSLKLYRNSALPQYSEGQWLLDKNISGGVAMDLHIHDVDIVYWLLHKPAWLISNANENVISTIYGYENTNVTSEASWCKQTSYPFNAGYDAHFEKVSIVYRDWKLYIYEGEEHKEIINIFDEVQSEVIQTNDAYMNEILYFVKCVENGKEPIYCLPEDSLMAHEILLAEIESAKKCSICNMEKSKAMK